MDPASTGVSVLVILAGLLIIGWSSAVELALSNVDRKAVRKLVERGDPRAVALEALLRVAGRILFSLSTFKKLGISLVAVAIVVIVTRSPARFDLPISLLCAFLVWTTIAISSVIGRTIGNGRSQSLVLVYASTISWLDLLLRPFTAPLGVLTYALSSGQEDDGTDTAGGENVFLTDEGLRLLMDVRSEVEDIQETERQMIARILDMDDTTAHEVMVPRIDILALDVETDFQEALDVIIKAGHSRIPVYEEDVDHILGLLYAKDMLKSIGENRVDMPLRDLLRSAHFVPESKKLDELFAEMQKRRVHIAIVVDEYGGTAGLLTVEDILEEIVGDIEDEHDPHQDDLVRRISPDRYLVSSRLPLHTLVELLSATFDVDSVDTLGGLVYSLFGRVPEQGEVVDAEGWRFTVVSLEGRRIEQVHVEAVVPDAPGDTKSESSDVTDREVASRNSVTDILPLN